MSTMYDQSGKIFTHVIAKEPVKVIIRTRTSRIEGEIYKKHDERVSDAVNETPQFIAVTNAVIYELQAGVETSRQADFLVVNRDAIEWLLPQEQEQ